MENFKSGVADKLLSSNPKGYYDLHAHSTASDGTFTPAQLLELAQQIGLTGLSITDHDTIDGIEESIRYLNDNSMSVDLIPGIEMNTEMNGWDIHILGYFIDYSNDQLLQHLQNIKEARFERAVTMVEKLDALGLPIEFSRVQEIAGDDLIARPHIARALMEKGYVSSMQEAFAKYLERNGKAYVPRYKFTPEKAISLIKKAGGVCILAHPGLIMEKQIRIIIEMGIEGLEAYYPLHTEEATKKFLKYCQQFDLLITGGSDFHGFEDTKNHQRLGACGVELEQVNRIKNYISRKR
jgi:predicted metal-dependent phosphoesterase TrpH